MDRIEQSYGIEQQQQRYCYCLEQTSFLQMPTYIIERANERETDWHSALKERKSVGKANERFSCMTADDGQHTRLQSTIIRISSTLYLFIHIRFMVKSLVIVLYL